MGVVSYWLDSRAEGRGKKGEASCPAALSSVEESSLLERSKEVRTPRKCTKLLNPRKTED